MSLPLSGDQPLELDGLPDNVEELETRSCEECGERITGKIRGAGSAAWKMGLHRANKHGIKGTGRAGRRKKGAPSDEQIQAHPISSGIASVAAEIGIGGKAAPTGDQLGDGLGKILEILALGGAVWAAETDPAIHPGPEGDAARDATVNYLALPGSAAKSVMHPVGRILAPTRVNRRYGRTVVENTDIAGAVVDFGTFCWHWREYMRSRAQIAQRMSSSSPSSPAPSSPANLSAVPDPFTPDPFTPVTQQGMTTTPPPTNGVLLTPDRIAQIRSQNQ
jgi:hypothetical protein